MQFSIFIFFFGVVAIFAMTEDDSDFYGDTASSSSLIVEHSFDQGANPVFVRRGTINIRSITAGSANFREEGSGLSEEDKQTLKKLSGNDGIYKIRVKKNSADDTSYVGSFMKACSLVESRLSDIITVNFDASGNLLGASIRTKIPYCTQKTISDKELSHFTTDVEIKQTITGPVPETQTYIQKIEQEKVEKEKGGQTDNRSFLAKYWMYIVPFVVVMMLAQTSNPDQGGGGR